MNLQEILEKEKIKIEQNTRNIVKYDVEKWTGLNDKACTIR